MAYNPNFRANKSKERESGAKEGLEQKMKYWRDKDYQYEFGVSLGQALNLAFETHMPINVPDGDIPQSEKILNIFKLILKLKIDPDFVETFDEYYNAKKRSIEKEKVFDTSTGEKIEVIQIQ